VVHMPSFYSVSSVAGSDKMYLAPEQRVTLW
jgi:predicted metalloendopeptidase